MRLFSYCLPFDDGAAPNPFWGTCTLVICKPAIRRGARVGDLVAGTGAKFSRLGDGSTRDLSGRLVYAMKVTEKMTMAEYDAYTATSLPGKVPDWNNPDQRRRLGDAIYDFSVGTPVQRQSVHGAENQDTDLAGAFALLSTHFLYFGANAITLPDELKPVAQNRQGHRVKLNEPYVSKFAAWLELMGPGSCALLGEPLLDLFETPHCAPWCAASRAEADHHDEANPGDADYPL